jgi:hypothetical protein
MHVPSTAQAKRVPLIPNIVTRPFEEMLDSSDEKTKNELELVIEKTSPSGRRPVEWRQIFKLDSRKNGSK